MPMLNRPARKPSATPRPVKISGVAARSDSLIGRKARMIRSMSPERTRRGRTSGSPGAREQRAVALRHGSDGLAERLERVRGPQRDQRRVREHDDDGADDERREEGQERHGQLGQDVPDSAAAVRCLDGRRGRGRGSRGRERLAHGSGPAAGRGLAAARSPGAPRLEAHARLGGRHRAAHVQADALGGRLRRVEDPHDPALVHDGDPVAQREHLVELGGHDQHRSPLVTLLDHSPVDVLDRADVQAPRRLGGHEQLDRPAELARDDHLLLVAAGQVVDLVEHARRPDVELLDQLGRRRHDRVPVEAQAVGERLEVVGVEHHVLGDRERRHQALLEPVLRHVRDAGLEDRRGSGRISWPAMRIEPARGRGGP